MTLPTAYIDTALSSPPPGVLPPAYGSTDAGGELLPAYGDSAALALNFSGNYAFDPRITYTGASARMYFDSTGELKYAPMNLVLQSGDIEDAAWNVKTTVTITPSVSDPDGGTTAFTVRADGVNSVIGQTITGTSGAAYTGAWWIRRRTGSGNISLRTGDNSSIAISPTGTWQRLSGTDAATASTTIRCYVVIATSGDEVDVWHPSLNLGSTAFDYIPTTSAAVYLPRSNAYQDHNPSTLAPLGFLIEEARTNSIRNNTMQGAVAGSTGTIPTNWQSASSATGISRNSVAVGTENGIPYVDIRYTGTASSSGTVQITAEQSTGVAALTAQVWTASYYLKHVGGTLPGNVSTVWLERNAGGASVATGNTPAITVTNADLATQRTAVTRTLSGGGTVAFVTNRIDINVTNGAVVDFTLRIGLPQLELGAFATSPILTTAAAATRLADQTLDSVISDWYNPTEGTFVIEGDTFAPGSETVFVANAYADISNRAETVWTAASGLRTRVVNAGVTNTVGSGVAISETFKVASALKTSDSAVSVSGSAPATDTGVTLPVATSFAIGYAGYSASSFLNGHLQSLTYYRRRLPNETLQTLTS